MRVFFCTTGKQAASPGVGPGCPEPIGGKICPWGLKETRFPCPRAVSAALWYHICIIQNQRMVRIFSARRTKGRLSSLSGFAAALAACAALSPRPRLRQNHSCPHLSELPLTPPAGQPAAQKRTGRVPVLFLICFCCDPESPQDLLFELVKPVDLLLAGRENLVIPQVLVIGELNPGVKPLR